jgi:meiotically up-regulated gene 157 (Mug157) protein
MRKPFLLSVLLAGFVSANGTYAMATDMANYEICHVDAVKPALKSNRPEVAKRLFRSDAVEKEIKRIVKILKNEKLAWMFANCFPNTLDTTVHYEEDANGNPDTFVYTGDIHAMWLRDSGAQVWPYVQLCKKDKHLQKMLAGVIMRQIKCINCDPYANAFNKEPNPNGDWMEDTGMHPELHERKYEIDSLCYPIRLAYEYWKVTGDTSVFNEDWVSAVKNILKVFKEQQRKDGKGSYHFLRKTDRALDTVNNNGWGAPAKPVGLIASFFRPSDDATTFLFLVPSNFMAVTSLNKAAEILTKVNKNADLATQCSSLADEVHNALMEHAVYNHPKYGKIYAFEVDGYGNHMLMDDANVPSLLAMPYLGDVDVNDPIYQNTRRFVWSEDNPYFFRGKAGEGIGGPHIGYDMVWPMSIMMKAFTSKDDAEIKWCIKTLMDTDAGTGFMHESFNKDDATDFTRAWFAWQNTLFGELIIKLVNEGKADLLNSIE